MSNPVIVCIDDERSFTEEVTANTEFEILYATSSQEGIELLKRLQDEGREVAELWLDHDLGEINTPPYWDTIMPVVVWLEELGCAGTPYPVNCILVHTMNASAAPAMMEALKPHYTVYRQSPIQVFR